MSDKTPPADAGHVGILRRQLLGGNNSQAMREALTAAIAALSAPPAAPLLPSAPVYQWRTRDGVDDWADISRESYEAIAGEGYECRVLYTRPAAAATGAREGWVLVPERMELTPDALEMLQHQTGGTDPDSMDVEERWTGGTLWVGWLSSEGEDGGATYGLHVANADYPEDGSVTLVEFAEPLAAAPQEGEANG